jgi:hypothetical protein
MHFSKFKSAEFLTALGLSLLGTLHIAAAADDDAGDPASASTEKRRASDHKDDALAEITVLGQRTTPEIARDAQRQAPNLINLTTAERGAVKIRIQPADVDVTSFSGIGLQ